MTQAGDEVAVLKRSNIFWMALFAVILLSNYVLAMLDGSILALNRDGAQVPALHFANMVLGPTFLVVFMRLFILILQNSLFSVPSASLEMSYRNVARTMLCVGMVLALVTLLQTFGHPAMYVLPPMYIAMSLCIWYGSQRGRGMLHSVLYYLALLLMVVSSVYITPILHYRNVFFQGSQLMAWVAYAYCRRYASTIMDL